MPRTQYGPGFYQAIIDGLLIAAAIGITTAATTCVQALTLLATERDAV